MDEKQRAQAFSTVVDKMLKGEPVDDEGMNGEIGELLALAQCLAENRYVPRRPSFQQDLEQSLLNRLKQRKERGITDRIKTLLIPYRLGWRPILSNGLLLLMLGIAILLLNPTVRAQISELLRWTGVHELQEIPIVKVEITELPTPGPLDAAQAQASFRILQPTYLPEGYTFGGVTTHRIHDFAIGPTVVLYYFNARTGGSITISEFKARRKMDEAIKAGYSQEVTVNGRQAIYVNGEWEFDWGGLIKKWRIGRSDRLLFEIGDIVIWMRAERPPLGVEELVRIAESFQ